MRDPVYLLLLLSVIRTGAWARRMCCAGEGLLAREEKPCLGYSPRPRMMSRTPLFTASSTANQPRRVWPSVLGGAPDTPRGDAHRARSGAFGNRYREGRLELSAPYIATRLPARSTLTW